MDKPTVDFWHLLKENGLEDDTCLIIDESGNPKKGKRSDAIKRQYCGQIGKTENCQVGVFGALCGGSLVNLVQARLSLGAEATKIDLAKEIKHVWWCCNTQPILLIFSLWIGMLMRCINKIHYKQIHISIVIFIMNSSPSPGSINPCLANTRNMKHPFNDASATWQLHL